MNSTEKWREIGSSKGQSENAIAEMHQHFEGNWITRSKQQPLKAVSLIRLTVDGIVIAQI
jgi:hypothetical protein